MFKHQWSRTDQVPNIHMFLSRIYFGEKSKLSQVAASGQAAALLLRSHTRHGDYVFFSDMASSVVRDTGGAEECPSGL